MKYPTIKIKSNLKYNWLDHRNQINQTKFKSKKPKYFHRLPTTSITLVTDTVQKTSHKKSQNQGRKPKAKWPNSQWQRKSPEAPRKLKRPNSTHVVKKTEEQCKRLWMFIGISFSYSLNELNRKMHGRNIRSKLSLDEKASPPLHHEPHTTTYQRSPSTFACYEKRKRKNQIRQQKR